MKKNIGKIDLSIRFILGFLLTVGGLYILLAKISQLGLFMFIIGCIIIATTLLKWCPFYLFFGFNTCDLDMKYRYKK